MKGEVELKTGPFGTQLHASDYVEEGTPVINVRNIGFGEIREEKLEFISEETVQRLSSHLLEPYDIVFGRKGAVERHVFISAKYAGWFQGSDCLRLRFKSDDVFPRFISYYLLTDFHKQWMINQCSHGATMASLNQEIISRIPLLLPSYPTQRRIATVLSDYDDLIENNTRRIKLLRELRQLIFERYKKLHSNHTTNQTLGEIVDKVGGIVRTGPFGSQLHESDYSEVGIPVVMPKNIIEGRIVTNDIARVPSDFASKLSNHTMNVGDIVYGRRGDIGRRAIITKRQQGWICGTGCLRISLKGELLHPRFLYEYLGQPEVVSLIASRAIGATMPNLNTSILRGISILMPDYKVQREFADTVLPYDELIENIVEKNSLLRVMRDLLLPKLISGEIDVSNIPEPVSN